MIDPQREIAAYQEFAEAKGLTIAHVLETHIHADYASGAPALAEATSAKLWLSAYDKDEQYQYRMPHATLADGNEVLFGKLRIVAMHTPGHTPEHLSFLLFEQQGCGQPLGFFSGDFVLIGSLGRPDLLGDAEKQSLAGRLFESARHRIASLPDGTMVYPAHGAGSLCGVGISERADSTIGYERHCNVFMATSSKEDFISKILGSVPQFPEYYKRMKALNSEGAPALKELPGQKLLTASAFRTEVEMAGSVILDLRSPDAFGGAHIPGALISVPALTFHSGPVWYFRMRGTSSLSVAIALRILRMFGNHSSVLGMTGLPDIFRGESTLGLLPDSNRLTYRKSPFENCMRRCPTDEPCLMSAAQGNGRRGTSHLPFTYPWAI